MKHNSFPQKHPYLFTALLEILVILVYLIAGTAAFLLELPSLTVYLIANSILTITCILMITLMGAWKTIGVRPLENPRDLLLFWLPAIPIIVNLAFGIKTENLSGMITFLFLALTVGFVEEVIFRGLMLQALLSRGTWKAAIISAILFGLSHSLNTLTGTDMFYVLLQVGYALAIGFGFAAAALRSRSILPLIIIHFLIDFAGYLAADQVGAAGVDMLTIIISIVYILSFSVYGIILLRKKPVIGSFAVEVQP